MDEYLCLTVLSRPGEPVAEFNKRMIVFWSHMLRAREADYERVYAESTQFGTTADRASRQYMLELGVEAVLAQELASAGIDFLPIDSDDVYSRYEATPPDWFQIEH